MCTPFYYTEIHFDKYGKLQIGPPVIVVSMPPTTSVPVVAPKEKKE